MSNLSVVIRCLRATGHKQATIAAMLNCSRSYVSEVLSGKKGAGRAISKAELKRRLTVAIKALAEIKEYAAGQSADEYKIAEKALQEVQG